MRLGKSRATKSMLDEIDVVSEDDRDHDHDRDKQDDHEHEHEDHDEKKQERAGLHVPKETGK